ncbi:hypothetical protein M441DRAFT_154066 [Trichoderma asperellum CBS 433.97]|uniref:Sulfotransferase domain-containing protein n=1 Tax=Trichoderma asperellum (strain ATCC 204424 / CBS 433.97 / NBRC 101777) TaxID=1042311 RepID=A0A2T3YRC2_TRIA4|nr:hypothetical protein M441DRAFT_154066 [Trichoderma asperellum CBS 433.97]PTB35123.1 hypothetical protein M441DRAFT_154066 [Trichoderma asperellum CBS 433.97]
MLQARKIDEFPNPAEKPKVKVIVLSCSKTGTLGLYRAFKILGYKPYHAAEFVRNQNHSHKIFFQEALLAEHNRFSGLKPYGRAEFDKWFQDYDSIIEVPCYMLTQILSAYLSDPNVKFLLTERDPDKWVRSFNKQVGGMNDYLASAPMAILRYFDIGLWHHWRFNSLVYDLFSGTTKQGHSENEEILRQNYANYNNLVKKLIPGERLRIIKLEEGLGWDELCDFLEVSKPSVPYPNFDNHMELRDAILKPLITRALVKLALVTASVVEVGVVLCWKKWT